MKGLQSDPKPPRLVQLMGFPGARADQIRILAQNRLAVTTLPLLMDLVSASHPTYIQLACPFQGNKGPAALAAPRQLLSRGYI